MLAAKAAKIIRSLALLCVTCGILLALIGAYTLAHESAHTHTQGRKSAALVGAHSGQHDADSSSSVGVTKRRDLNAGDWDMFLEPPKWLDACNRREMQNDNAPMSATEYISATTPQSKARDRESQLYPRTVLNGDKALGSEVLESLKKRSLAKRAKRGLDNNKRPLASLLSPTAVQLVKSTLGSDASVETTTPATPTSADKVVRELSELHEALFAQDIRFSWNIYCAVNTAARARALVAQLSTCRDSDQAAQGAHQRQWLPSFESLSYGSSSNNTLQQQQQVSSRELLVNVSKYAQFFAVAIEQMQLEQEQFVIKPTKKCGAQVLGELERTVLRAICDLDNLVQRLDAFEETAQTHSHTLGLLQSMSSAQAAANVATKSAVDTLERRLHYRRVDGGQPLVLLRSPLATAADKSGATVRRDVWPAQARAQQHARAARDKSILTDLDKLLGYYESALKNMYYL